MRLYYFVPIRIVCFIIISLIMIYSFIYLPNSLLYATSSPSSFCTPKFGKVTIFVAIDNLNLTKTKYKDSISSLTCFAKRRGYKLIIIDVFKDYLTQRKCSHLKNMLFRRHCAGAVYLSKTDWLLTLDADNGVINFDHCIEEYIKPEFDVIHAERFHNGEIAANYIVKNSRFSYNYLMEWSRYENNDPAFKNYDNGALHYHLLKSLNLDWVTNEDLLKCEQMGYKKTFSEYFAFVGCIKAALRGKRNFKHIKIYRRGHGFARDTWITDNRWSDLDFILHAMKPPFNVHFESDIDVEKCSAEDWTLPTNMSLKISISEMVPLIRKADSDFVQSTIQDFYQSLLNSADVSNCWPQCPEEISWQYLKED